MAIKRFVEIELSAPPTDEPAPVFMRDCPACGEPNPADNEACDACGIVFAKVRGDRLPSSRTLATRNMGNARTTPVKPPPRVHPAVWLVLLAALGAVGWFVFLRPQTVVVGPPLGQGRATVILLHAFGSPPDALVPRARELGARLPEVTWLIPPGPHAARGGRAWVVGADPSSQRASAAESHAVIQDVIDDAISAGVAPEALSLGGYAQGAQIALTYMLSEGRTTPGGLILLSGGRPTWGEARTLADAQVPEGTRVFIAHGENDAVISITQAARQRAQLVEGGAAVVFHASPAGHTVDPTSLDTLVQWLAP